MPVPPPGTRRLRRMRRLAALAALAAAALLATGCFRMEISIDVNDDGTGTARFLSAVETSTMEMFGEEGLEETPVDEIDPSELPEGATVEAYNEDGFEGQRITIPFTHEGDVAAAFAAMETGETDAVPIGSADDPFEEFELRRDGDRWVFNAAINVGEEMGEDVGNPAEDEMMRGFFESASFTVRIKLPGKVTEHNADRVADDGALIWDLDVLDPQTRQMSATSDPSQAAAGGGGGGISPAVIIGIVVALVVIAGAAYYFMQRRRTTGETPASTA